MLIMNNLVPSDVVPSFDVSLYQHNNIKNISHLVNFDNFANVFIFLDNYFCNGIIIVPTLFA